MSAVELRSVTLQMGDRRVLDQVDLTLGDAEFIGVLGPNGAGKTTLMRAVLGLVRPSAGTIHVLGKPAVRGNPAIGYMPQTRSQAPIGRLSGWDFVAGAADGHRWGLPLPSAQSRHQIAWALQLVGATELATRSLAQLSGGERQRLLLAQALLGAPRLLLLDEPLISLDPSHQQAVVELAKRIQRELKITVLFTAHELNPLLNALDRVLYLGNGQVALGTVGEVINGPALSRLYGAPIDVVHINGRIFVMSGSQEVERDEHRHHAHDHHDHSH
jgi:zinc/manganese transport system ATP-binding protein